MPGGSERSETTRLPAEEGSEESVLPCGAPFFIGSALRGQHRRRATRRGVERVREAQLEHTRLRVSTSSGFAA